MWQCTVAYFDHTVDNIVRVLYSWSHHGWYGTHTIFLITSMIASIEALHHWSMSKVHVWTPPFERRDAMVVASLSTMLCWSSIGLLRIYVHDELLRLVSRTTSPARILKAIRAAWDWLGLACETTAPATHWKLDSNWSSNLPLLLLSSLSLVSWVLD